MGDVNDDNKQNVAGAFVFGNGSFASMNVAIAGEHIWFPDLEATSHLTWHAPSMTNSVPYSGASKVTVANGQSLLISSTGQSTFLINNKPLHMKNLMYVLGITKNLMSVSQFSNDNKVYFKFHATKCFF